jgi:gluconokinase
VTGTGTAANRHVVVMGVSGCGKSTVAEGLAAALGWPLAEADRFHPLANIAAMRSGRPLTDEDRRPWLADLAAWITAQEVGGRSSVMACSALRRAHRDVLRSGASDVVFVHLDGPAEVIASRVAARAGHFMPASLLDSQVATLEPLGAHERGVVLDVRADPDVLVEQALARLPTL